MRKIFITTILVGATAFLPLFGFSLGQSDQFMSVSEARELVTPFYAYLSGDESAENAMANYHEDWMNYYDNSNKIDKKGTFEAIANFKKAVPNMKWIITEVIVGSDNTIIVRGEGSGNPEGNTFLGKKITPGKGFKVMSIDIHHVVDGKIKQTYHLEDWFGGVSQLAGK